MEAFVEYTETARAVGLQTVDFTNWTAVFASKLEFGQLFQNRTTFTGQKGDQLQAKAPC
jgi:hypothetical protein